MAYEQIEPHPSLITVLTGTDPADGSKIFAQAKPEASYRAEYHTKAGTAARHHLHAIFHLGSYVLAREVIDSDTGIVERDPETGATIHEVDGNVPAEIADDLAEANKPKSAAAGSSADDVDQPPVITPPPAPGAELI